MLSATSYALHVIRSFISYLKDHLCEKKEKTRKQMKNINNTQCKRLNRWILSYFQ